MAECGAKNRRGGPCGMPAIGGSKPPRCWVHAGAVARERKRARRLGGKHRTRQLGRAASAPEPLELRSKDDAGKALVRVAREVMAGELDPRSANSVIGAVQALIDRNMLGVGPGSGSLLGFDCYKQITIHRAVDEDDEGQGRVVGEMHDGTRVIFSPEMEKRWGEWLKAECARGRDFHLGIDGLVHADAGGEPDATSQAPLDAANDEDPGDPRPPLTTVN